MIVIDSPPAQAYNRFASTRVKPYARRVRAISLSLGGVMNKQDLISKIAQDTGLTKSNAAAAVDSFIEGITKSLKKGQPITFVGFGTFKTAQRKARTARNPQTGASIKVPKRRVVRFSAGKALKATLN
jgi:DNA-binding protein HU-beta